MVSTPDQLQSYTASRTIKVFNVVKGRGMLGFSPVDAPQSHPLVRVLLLEVTIYSFFTPVHFLFLIC